MRIFAIRDEEDLSRKNLAYLIYYEREKRFYIELPDDADPWETPLLLSSFLKRGEKTVNAYWSKQWVLQRIVPTDRQNLGQILKENALSEYDEFELLMLADGRCAQDSYYLVPVDETIVAEQFATRYEKKIEDVIPLKDNTLLVFFRNGKVKRCRINDIVRERREFKPILLKNSIFENVAIQTGGHGVCWGENAEIMDETLYDAGIDVPLSMDDFISFVSNRVISTAEAAKILDCSRQNINDLVLRGKLHPIKTEQKSRYFLKSEIQQRLWI